MTFVTLPATGSKILVLDTGGGIYVPLSDITQGGNPLSDSNQLPVHDASPSLPFGAATEAEQAAGNASLASIDAKCINVDTGNVRIAASVLPTGASTSALQSTGNTSLSSIDGKTPALVTGRVPVDGSAVTQPISAASLPLPSGAATSALQSSLNALLPVSIGQKARAGSVSIALSTEDAAKVPALGAAVAAASVPVASPTLTNYKAAAVSVPIGGVNIRTGAGKLMAFQIVNNNAGTIVTQLFDSNTTPSSGDPPIWQASITTGNMANVTNYFGPLSVGLRLAISTSAGGYSAPVGASTVTYTFNVEN